MTPQRFGPYEVLAAIAKGGQGAVLRARDAQGTEIALKLLLKADDRSQRRFRQEAAVLDRLDHPGVVKVRAHGVEGGVPWLAMDLVVGQTLRDLVLERGPLEPLEAARLVAALARALEHVHARGVVHRDLKPENAILERASGRPVLVDFGLLRRDAEVFGELSIDARSRLSHTGELRGTPAYMAPEQVSPAKFGAIGPATDVYGLGGVLHYLLTAAPPVVADSLPNLIFQLLESTASPDPSTLREDLPPALRRATQRALARMPADRFPSAAALADELEAIVRTGGRGASGGRAALAAVLVGVGAVALLGAVTGTWLARRAPDAAAPDAAAPDAAAPDAAALGSRAIESDPLAEVEAALARADAVAALTALERARASPALDPGTGRRAAALEAEARWLASDLDGAGRAVLAAGREGEVARALLEAVKGTTSLARERLAGAPDRPAVRLGRAIARHRPVDPTGDAGRAALLLGVLALEAPGADVERLARRSVEWWSADREGLDAALCARREGAGPPVAKSRARLVAAARERVDALAARVPLDADPAATLAGYRLALAPLRWLLVLDPAPSLPPGLVALAGRLRLVPLVEQDALLRDDALEGRRAYYKERNPRGSAAFRAKLETLRDRATTRAGRREMAHLAADLLVDEGDPHIDQALAWTDEFTKAATFEDHEVLIVRAMLLGISKRFEDALALLDGIVEDDPLHGDARERRALILVELDRQAEAEADLPLATFDPGREHFASMRGWRDPHYQLAKLQRARGDLRAALATCDAGLAWNARYERATGRVAKLRSDLLAAAPTSTPR